MVNYYAKTNKIHKLVYSNSDVCVLECGGVSSDGKIYDEIDENKFNKCQVCFYDEFN